MEFIQKKHFFIATIILAILMGGLGYSIGVSRISLQDDSMSPCKSKFELLDQTLDCDRIEESKGSISTMDDYVTAFIDEKKRTGEIMHASVFFRDLKSRRWFGVNADDEYYPASLAKLPLAITYYKIAEIDPNIWDQYIPVVFSPQFSNNGQMYGTDSPMQIGKTYNIRDMITNMLTYSDNRLLDPLTKYVNPEAWQKTSEDLGIRKQTSEGNEEWSVSSRVIANIFRSLYNSSYLDPSSSDELLHTMTAVKFTSGIVAGVPLEIKVAHKFGEAIMQEINGTQTPVLHDCGIIYKSEKPYILCVMTEGKSFKELSSVIAGISKIVYDAQ